MQYFAARAEEHVEQAVFIRQEDDAAANYQMLYALLQPP